MSYLRGNTILLTSQQAAEMSKHHVYPAGRVQYTSPVGLLLISAKSHCLCPLSQHASSCELNDCHMKHPESSLYLCWSARPSFFGIFNDISSALHPAPAQTSVALKCLPTQSCFAANHSRQTCCFFSILFIPSILITRGCLLQNVDKSLELKRREEDVQSGEERVLIRQKAVEADEGEKTDKD